MLKNIETQEWAVTEDAITEIYEIISEDPKANWEIYVEVYEATRTLDMRSSTMGHLASSVVDRAQKVLDRCNGGTRTLNSLGELQSTGPALDVAIALYCDAENKALSIIHKYEDYMQNYEDV